MKQLLLFLVLITVLGVGGFAYRYVMEMPHGSTTACTLEARMCPDGTAVGRTGPNCSFAACAFPNIEIPEANIALAVPSGYTHVLSGTHADTLGTFSKPSASPQVAHSIHIRRYPIPEGRTADQVILENTRYQPADMQAEDFSRFGSVTIGERTYRTVVIERFEAVVQSSYFLVRDRDVLRFDIIEHDVANWTDSNLTVENLPEHQALRALLRSLQEIP